MQISPMVCCGDFALISVGCEKPPGVCLFISCRGAQTFPTLVSANLHCSCSRFL